MKNVLLSALFAILIVACVAKEAKDKKKEESCCSKKEASACCSGSEKDDKCKSSCSSKSSENAVAVSVDELLATPEKYLDKKVDLSGLVVHTCKKSGKKMFLKGSNDSIYIKVEAGDKISKFEPSLEGSSVVASGILSAITLDDHDEAEECASEEKGKDFTLTCEEFKTL